MGQSQSVEKGIQGLQGPLGDKGIQGLQGPLGDKGIQGIQGLPGLPGLPGDQGIQGDKGVQGIQGIQGDKGVNGVTGVSEYNGAVRFNKDISLHPDSVVLIDEPGVVGGRLIINKDIASFSVPMRFNKPLSLHPESTFSIDEAGIVGGRLNINKDIAEFGVPVKFNKDVSLNGKLTYNGQILDDKIKALEDKINRISYKNIQWNGLPEKNMCISKNKTNNNLSIQKCDRTDQDQLFKYDGNQLVWNESMCLNCNGISGTPALLFNCGHVNSPVSDINKNLNLVWKNDPKKCYHVANGMGSNGAEGSQLIMWDCENGGKNGEFKWLA